MSLWPDPTPLDTVAVRVFLLDDHASVRTSVREALEDSGRIAVVGEAATAGEAVAQVPTVRPDVAILDVRLPDGSGVEVCREIRDLVPALRCVMLSSLPADDAVMQAILAGASGYFLKQIRASKLVDGVIRVARGESLLDPAVILNVLHRLHQRDEARPAMDRLTSIEREVLDAVGRGLTNWEIAAELHLTTAFVVVHVSRIFAKCGFGRRFEIDPAPR